LAKRSIDVSQTLRTFEGEVYCEEGAPIPLKYFLLRYCRNAQAMGITEAEMDAVYSLGFVIGTGAGQIVLDQAQYDALKRVCDLGKVRNADGSETYVFSLEFRKQVKQIVDSAAAE
jgi:hypothetical protein